MLREFRHVRNSLDPNKVKSKLSLVICPLDDISQILVNRSRDVCKFIHDWSGVEILSIYIIIFICPAITYTPVAVSISIKVDLQNLIVTGWPGMEITALSLQDQYGA